MTFNRTRNNINRLFAFVTTVHLWCYYRVKYSETKSAKWKKKNLKNPTYFVPRAGFCCAREVGPGGMKKEIVFTCVRIDKSLLTKKKTILTFWAELGDNVLTFEHCINLESRNWIVRVFSSRNVVYFYAA